MTQKTGHPAEISRESQGKRQKQPKGLERGSTPGQARPGQAGRLMGRFCRKVKHIACQFSLNFLRDGFNN